MIIIDSYCRAINFTLLLLPLKMEKQPQTTEDNDDIPVSALIARKVQASEATPQQSVAAVTKPDADSEPDSDDDIPVLHFIKKRLAKVAEDAAKEKEKEREKRKREEREASQNKKEKSSKREPEPAVEKPKVSSSSANSSKSSQFYSSCDKGRLIQALLIRWWYAYDWPLPEDIGVPPSGYESLDGFPGVFVSTRVCTRVHQHACR